MDRGLRMQVRTVKRVAVLAAVFVALAASTSLVTSRETFNGTNPVFDNSMTEIHGVNR